MIDLIKQFEDVPLVYPDAPVGLSDNAAALDSDMIWQRIEAYTAHRFTPREVVWTLMGHSGDEFHPRLTPLVSSVAQYWEADTWNDITLSDGPLGLCLPICGTYKVTAQVGAGDVPAAVSEAFRRLAEYSVELTKDSMVSGHPSHTNHDVNIGGSISESYRRSVNWTARSMQLSGAADLLRPYRRA